MKRIGVVGLSLVALLAFSSVVVASASASEWNVSTKAKAGTFSATSGTIRILDGETEFTCEEGTLSGTLKEGTKILGTEVGEVTAATFNKGAETCTGPLSIKGKLVISGFWKFLAGQRLGATLVDGTLDILHIDWSGSLCGFLVLGSIPVLYHNNFQFMLLGKSLGTGLTVSGVSGCLGLIKNGDKPFLDATYAMEAGSDVLITEE
jgi:hypothetical protein